MRIQRVEVGVLEANCFLVDDGVGGDVVVIDPGGDHATVVTALEGRRVAAVILTHGHFDHTGGVADLIAASGAPLLVHEQDAERITHGAAHGTMGELFGISEESLHADRTLRDGENIDVGAMRMTVLHTPGHTEGSICLLARGPQPGPEHLFSGDTLFAGSVGRTDFPGGDPRTLARSIAEKLSGLAADTVVHPGHGPETTIQREARINPFWPRA